MPEELVLLLTDVVDSTALNATLGDQAMRRLWEDHDRLTRLLIRRHGGQEIGRSDGFLIVFDTVDGAVAFAVDYHQALDDFMPPLRARVGIHVGPMQMRANSAEDIAAGATRYDIDGIALPVAARICAVARARQTLLSRSALIRSATLTPTPTAALKTCSHGMWQFKGLDEPLEVFEIGDDRADLLPPEDGDKGYRVVAVPDGWRPAREIRNSVPADRDAFFGRHIELRQLAQLLEAGTRVVSVVGIGGVGKTRLTKHFARRWLGHYPGGAWFCDLAEARDSDGICSAVAHGLDLALGRSDPPSRLADAIASRGRCLVLLDNCEQLLLPLRDLLGPWLDRAPDARFVITSRERLGIAGEHVCPIDSLASDDAGELFRNRALAAAPALQIGAGDATAIGELVELLDRLPLAIELAAGRLGVMSPSVMRKRLDERFSLLAARQGSRPPRHLTLWAALDWSWELLTRDEQCVLAQLSVFAGGFDLDAADAVLVTLDARGADALLDVLQSLVDKSLVRFEGDRFTLLVSVREYAAERLGRIGAASPELALAAVEVRHGRHYAERTKGPAADFENVLAACRRAIARADCALLARACTTAWRWLETRGPSRTALELLESALAVDGLSKPDRTALLCLHGRCLLVAGNLRGAREELTLALEEARSIALRDVEQRALNSLAELNAIEGRLDDAKLLHEQAVRITAEIGPPASHCAALNGLGNYYKRLGQFEPARAQYVHALDVARAADDLRWIAGTLANLGPIEAELGNRTAAKAHYDEAIVIARRLDDRVSEGNLLCNLGLFHLEEGDHDAARAELARSLVLARHGGLSLLESVVLCNLGLLEEASDNAATAERAYREALAVARRRGDQRSQGQFLGYLGLVVVRRGDLAEGRALLDESLTLLRRVRDRSSLAVALCRHAQACFAWRDVEGARAALAEAAALADEIGVIAGSELATELDAGRRAVDAA